MINKIICSALLMTTLFLTGCSLLSPVATTQTNTYVLKVNNSIAPVTRGSSSINLLVSEPTAPAWLNTSKMAYQTQPSQINYFSKNEWADTPTHMLQNSVVASLQQSGRFHAVLAAPFMGNYDRRLDLRIVDFLQDFTQGPSYFHLQVVAILINGQTNQVIQSLLINERIPATSNSPLGGVQAANIAVSRLSSAVLKLGLSH